ncbi:hypothetical protein Bca52824_021835 [Brassica carinata]|uniref:DUF4283 domain-containing protein n=1 Tax=Brassica carinata TaxID=52824 RepID=A0A8X7VF15_BRACI|nr:hypothetical protein Bca52824_021835 [Brassica carinata]
MSSSPPVISPEGIPRVLIPDEVFQRGALQHKDFVVGRFFGKTPAFKTIQNVLNYLWGKGNRLEIHLIKSSRSMIVRIPSDYIREKVLKKRIWYVDTAMFHVAQWSDGEVADTSSLESIPIWAHLIGVPFDLMTNEGLGWIADAIGDPKEMDDWTKNLSSLSVAHVKVEADATKPFPTVLELVRQSGATFRVEVEYPWLPPTCSHCKELGHIIKDCLKITRQWVPVNKSSAILETHIKEPNLNQLLTTFCPGWSYISNHNTDEDGRNRQSLTCKVTLQTGQFFYFSAVYASNHREERLDLWKGLLEVQQTYYLEDQSWLIGGDLNQIIHHAEHSSPSVNHLTMDMVELRDFFLDLGIEDLRYQGNSHTWTNKRPENPVTKKLDRAMVNSHWIRNFPNSIAFFLPHEFSDHSPCVVNLVCPLPSSGTKPFKFFNHLTSHPDFLSSTEVAWTLAGSTASDLASLGFKLKNIKRPLKSLHKESFSDIQKRVCETNSLLKMVQVQAMANPSTILFTEERDLQEKYHFLRGIEESFFHQKSRVNWLRLGDHNTPFYQSVAAARASQNSIRSITLSDGSIISDPDIISAVAISHFQSILAPTVLPNITASYQWLQELHSLSCSDHHRQLMSTVPTCAEIANGDINAGASAKVSWESCCHSKEEGGLGLRNLESWNMACVLKMIWLLFFLRDSIWSSWFRDEILDGNTEMFWRNNRLHNARFSSADALIAQIKLTVKNRISSLRIDRPKFSSALLQLWFSS